MMRVALIVGIVICAGVSVRGAQKAEDLEFFEKSIRPVLVERCYSCHSADAEKLKGDLKLDSRADLLKGGTDGPVVVPGNAETSRLIEAIRYHNADFQMPPAKQGKLPDEQIADFVRWVNSGAPFPESPGVTNSKAASAKPHWAFQPVGNPPVPSVREKKWVRSPVDNFILSKLEAAKLPPSPPADPRTLIRRATYDLTGLPPTPEEVDAFARDHSPAAYEKLVDRLLASPRYGERWGRYWLDVARYADTKGYVYGGREETKFVHSAAYRDWVIRAFNEDLPYDQFLKLQIAADQMDADRESLAAMGYLTLGRRFLGVVHDIIDDRIDVLMRGTQALTVSCARCHDHKFDPIPTKDYYSLYGVFAGSYERTIELDARSISAKNALDYDTELKKREDKYREALDRRREEQAKRFRARTTEYLRAVLEVEKLSTETFYAFVTKDEINPVVVRQWQTYLLAAAKSSNSVWAPWNAFATSPTNFTAFLASTNKINPLVVKALTNNPPATMRDLADRYGALLLEVDAKWTKAEGKKLSANEEELRLVLHGPDSPAAVPSGAIVDLEWFFDEPTRVELGTLQAQIDLWMTQSPGSPPHAVILQDRALQRNPRVFRRGNPANKGDEVPRQYLAILSGAERKPFATGSGRFELANAIASKDNPLTARVMANRIWLHHFGAGLVRTPSDFGTRSDPPSHPELLDWLARDFMDHNWSIKKLQRTIMLSATYQQSSGDYPLAAAADPENKLLARMNHRRLDFEVLRDSLLATSGRLDLKMGGPGTDLFKNPANARRSVYGFIDRQFLPGPYRVFDFANPDMHAAQRSDTTVPQQALFFMNSPFVVEQSRALAARAGEGQPREKLRELYRLTFQREPTTRQIAEGLNFIATVQTEPTNEVAKNVAGPWQYGYGEFDEAAKRLKSFSPLPYFNDEAWRGGAMWPDAALGWAQLTAEGGHAGNDLQHAVIRRWVSPIDGVVSIQGKIVHERPVGDGITAKIISSRHGLLNSWTLHNNSADVKIPALEVKRGETVDFYVSIAATLNSNDFAWAPVIQAQGKEFVDANGYAKEWNATKDFGGVPSTTLVTMSPWEKYAQVLLLANEFYFID